jgi:hypothetical protein
MIDFEHIEKGVASYIDSNIMNQFPETGWKRIVVAAAVGIGIKKYVNILKENELLNKIGLVTPDGAEIEMYAEQLKKEIPSAGMEVELPLLGELILHESDVDEVLKHIHKAERGF